MQVSKSKLAHQMNYGRSTAPIYRLHVSLGRLHIDTLNQEHNNKRPPQSSIPITHPNAAEAHSIFNTVNSTSSDIPPGQCLPTPSTTDRCIPKNLTPIPLLSHPPLILPSPTTPSVLPLQTPSPRSSNVALPLPRFLANHPFQYFKASERSCGSPGAA